MESDRIELRRKRDFGATINVVFEFIRKNWRPMGKSLLFIVGPVLLVASVVSGFYLRGILGMVDSLGRYGDSPPANPLAIFNDIWPVLILSAISGVISTIFLFAVVSGYVRLYVSSAPATLDVDDVWAEVRSSFWRL
ncbi:MAG: hypothetical protein H7X80_01200, partial [bacterium]|nr:hypothetical protein [Candidatus Kapabacteria bacterium]